MTKRGKIIGLVTLLLLVNVGLYLYLNHNRDTQPKIELEQSKGVKVKEKKKAPKQKQSAISESKNTLETQTLASEEQKNLVKEAMSKAIETLNNSKVAEPVKNDYASHLQNTNQGMLSVIVLMIKAGYKYDESTLEVYKSNSENVSQFVFEMKKDGVEPIAFACNYVQGTTQIEIANQHGEPVGLQSPDNSKQSLE